MPSVYLFNPPSKPTPQPRRNVSGYCALTYGVLEGMHQLGIEAVCANAGLCARSTGPFGPDYDFYLVQREPHVDTAAVFELLERHGCLARTAFLDSMDQRFGVDWFWRDSPACYFKTANRPEYDTTPLQFCIQDRFLPQSRPTPQDVVFYVCSLGSHPERAAIKRELKRGPWRCEFGPVTDPNDQPHELSHRVGGHHHAAFYRRLSECKVAVNVRGGAPDCYRYWEIAASHAVLVSFPVEEEVYGFETPPTPGVHYLQYRSAGDIPDAVTEALDRYDELHRAQQRFFLANHRSRNRALTVLRHLSGGLKVSPHACVETAP
jgi:hypothetical protein